MDLFVPSGGNFQTALNNAQPGDTITLQAGAAYTGNFVLPAKIGTGWITIRSSNLAALPPAGKRVKPADAVNMPVIRTPNSGNAIAAAPRARFYRMIGLEVTPAPGMYVWDLIALGRATEKGIEELPGDIEFDRMYIHGDPLVGGKRGVSLNSKNTRILNSWISDFKSDWQDAQAVAGWNGPGPFRIQNNYLEASGECLVFGGALPTIAGLIPSDIHILQNHLSRPVAWKGSRWWVKNLFQVKNGRRIRLTGNILENNWAHQQSGFAVQLTVRTENNEAPWNVIEDVTLLRNIIRHAGAGINLSGRDSGYTGFLRRVTLKDNLLEDINSLNWGGDGRALQILNASDYLTVNHNTFLQNGSIAVFEGPPGAGLVFRNNILPHNVYGIIGAGTSTAITTFARYAPGAVFEKNLVAGGASYAYPAGNFLPPTLDAASFVNFGAGDYRLQAGSPYSKAGTDGRDLGADIAGLLATTAGVVEGTPALIP